MTRLFVWIGGGLFVAALALCAWWYGVFLGVSRPPGGWRPLAVDASLFLVFAAHHSLFARASVKVAMARILPDTLLRSVYVWTASVLLMLVCLLWLPIGGTVYRHTGWLAWPHATVQLAGLVFIALSVRAIDPLELAGIRAATPGKVHVQTAGVYGLVRHPLYAGWVLIVFGAAAMTVDRLVFAAASSLYLVMAIPWEERSLGAAFGREYEEYQRRVAWKLIPGVW